MNLEKNYNIYKYLFLKGVDMREFGAFVFYGFFFISLVQFIGHFNYDTAPTSVSDLR